MRLDCYYEVGLKPLSNANHTLVESSTVARNATVDGCQSGIYSNPDHMIILHIQLTQKLRQLKA